ncbi:hypothetical protein THAOC_14099 [Thalassiosira oceanica]|uniref:Uncharacterized protein n=1 Tax=Thalassiosira oceanica TaxID=159749 RepID=K0SJH5_THAOC|nr:hypothetical protein THAOC_14099 [Thalassiosira oceanica]|eukprot:EJK65094.1 hypothetical protein THAOC_14099 [Thalassiosira oceanica]
MSFYDNRCITWKFYEIFIQDQDATVASQSGQASGYLRKLRNRNCTKREIPSSGRSCQLASPSPATFLRLHSYDARLLGRVRGESGESAEEVALASEVGGVIKMKNRQARPTPPGIVLIAKDRDVVNGKGQGVQRLKGNVNYRKAVKAHKVLYATCETNKVKIAKGIVKAIRFRGGRFLKFDERSGEYSELGNTGKQGAIEKTSQALREKQTAIRKQIRDFNETSRVGLPTTQFSDEEFYRYSLYVFASIEGEPCNFEYLPASVKEMVAISNLEANCGASPYRQEISFPASLAPVNNRHALMLAMARDHFPGFQPMLPLKHGMPAGEPSSGAPIKRAKISVEPTRDHFLDGRGIRSDRPGNVHWQEVSHGDALKKSSQALPRDGLPKGILKKGNHGKPDESLKDVPTAGDFKDIQAPLNDIKHTQVPLNDINVGDLEELDAANSILDLRGSRHSFLSNECVTKGDRTSASDRSSASMVAGVEFPRSSLASLGSWMRLSDTSTSIASVDSKMLEGRYSDISVDAPDEDNKDTKVDDIDYLELLRRKMRQAASSEDFVRAGELQQELRQLEELSRNIKAAAAKDDYVRAGELQSLYRKLTGVGAKRKFQPPPTTSSSDIPVAEEMKKNELS